MQYNKFGNTDFDISAISYGGIVSMNDGQDNSDRYVSWAIDQGINYFDVAPSYGDAEEKLGNSLKPYRNRIHLACKTGHRMRAEAEKDLLRSQQLLHTDYFDVYQLHGVSCMTDVERAFGKGGVMELVRTLKERGIARNVGITAHDEDAAIRCLELYDFDTVLFPFNWFMNLEHQMGSRLIKVAKERGVGVLCMKAFIERRWDSEEEKAASPFPKSWCKPIDVEDEAFGVAAMKYALSLGVDTLIPPGNFASFSFAVNHIDECLANPLNDQDLAFLRQKLELVRGKEFF
jgi:aryl-alcohol dehydrogenase-like predicted oxidoreductase